MQSKPKHCLQHGDRPVYARGRCKSCHVSIMRMIKAGELTDLQAVRRRLLLPYHKTKIKKCIRRDGRLAYARGVCFPCYRAVRSQIQAGTITEAVAIKKNLILASNRNY